MIRDYQIVSPSLEGVLSHDSIEYEGMRRPTSLLRALDAPSPGHARKPEDQKVLEEYFHDLYGIFMKRLSYFIVESESRPDDSVKLQAMLQEMIKVKKLIAYDSKGNEEVLTK